MARHLLLNALTVVRGGAQTLLARDLEPDARRELLEAVAASAEDVERVVRTVLEAAGGSETASP